MNIYLNVLCLIAILINIYLSSLFIPNNIGWNLHYHILAKLDQIGFYFCLPLEDWLSEPLRWLQLCLFICRLIITQLPIFLDFLFLLCLSISVQAGTLVLLLQLNLKSANTSFYYIFMVEFLGEKHWTDSLFLC